MRSSRRTRAQPLAENDKEESHIKTSSIRGNLRFTPSPISVKATKTTKAARQPVKKSVASAAKRGSLSGLPVKAQIRKTTAKKELLKKDNGVNDEDEMEVNEGDDFNLEIKNDGVEMEEISSKANETFIRKSPEKLAKVKLPRATKAKQPAKAPAKKKAAPVRKAPTRGKKVEEPKEELDEAQENDETMAVSQSEPDSSMLGEINFANLKLSKAINDSAISKMITFQGTYENKTAVIRLEKTLFNEDAAKKALCDQETVAKQDFINDIYSSYMIEPTKLATSVNNLKATVICPASESVLLKYSRSEVVFFSETADVYSKVVEPFIENKLKTEENCNKWVYNILDGVSEADRVILNDPDPESGFVLTPDLKWAGDEKDLYLVAICHRRDIRSLRDLREEHMILLKNIITKGTKAIKDKFKKNKDQLRSYVHYHPSFYHFHVHFKTVDPSDYLSTDRDHLLSTVINNITLNKDYYKKSTLTYPLSVSSALHQDLKKNKRI